MPDSIQEPAESGDKTRNTIALAIVICGLATTLTLAASIVLSANDQERAYQLVLTAVLPLIGTWVGTVLAFYFAKDNFEAAAKSTRESMGLMEKLRKIGVADPGVMMPFDQIKTLPVAPNEKPEDIKLTAVLEATKSHNRLPIVSSDNKAIYIMHRSIATAFVTQKAIAGANSDVIKSLTIGHIQQENNELFAPITVLAFVRRSATLAEAKRAMETRTNCRDVFVTETGSADEPIVGWVSNIDIARLSNAE